jgi:hypothetical protein
MTEASWGDGTLSPDIDWSMSARLANVERGGEELPEVASLRAVVRAWLELDPAHREAATLTPERPVVLDGVSLETLHGDAIAALAERLPD